MGHNCTTILVDGQKVRTLRDILPDPPDLKLKLLFVGKTPAPVSVALCHYFQGKQGKLFWSLLRKYRILVPTTRYEDDSLLEHGFGITDIAKVSRRYGKEPSAAEYVAGMNRILALIDTHHPDVVVFVYKKVLDEVLRRRFGVRKRSVYGFNDGVRRKFGSRVFAFPMPGTPCTREQAAIAMRKLARVVGTQ